ncbi:MAG: cobyrinic acid a,c-diamide synthase, partial [Clostridia bacterium]|nr:cobyrinic acid a,c-diamide synthase [Clostridia bacterium]
MSLDALLALAQEAAPLGPSPEAATPEIRPRQSAPPRQPVTVAVARDVAFCFHYRDNLELLERLGARLKFFSPLVDPVLPSGTQALLLGGGYPGVYGRCLSENVSMRETIRRALDAGVPCLAEGGGFLYLHESLVDADGVERPMVGA